MEIRWFKYARGHNPVLQFRVDGGEWQKVPMVFENDIYEALITSGG